MGRNRVLGALALVLILVPCAPVRAQSMAAMHHHGATTPADEAAAKKGAVSPPTFAPPPGRYAAPLAVALSTATAGATIYYTTDGSSPSRKSSPAYKGALTLAKTGKTTLRAFAYKKGLAASAVVSAVYDLTAAPPPSEEGGTLFLATLTPQGTASTTASGSATLTLTTDATAAFLRYTYGGLSGPITAQHIHAGDGSILFDLDTTPPQADGARIWRLQPVGTFTTEAILAQLRGGNCYLNLHTALYPTGEIKGYFRQASGSRTFTPPPAPPALPGGPVTAQDASRLLQQATYGARPSDVAEVQQKGLAAWIDEQMATPRSSFLAAYDAAARQLPPGTDPDALLVREAFYQQAVQGNDQLRQRMTLALSELFVVSDLDADVRHAPDGMASYLDLLAAHAFGNFRDLLAAVALSPLMGEYLDMASSSRSIPEEGRLPNENFAREVQQLFTIGLHELWPDGSLRLDAGGQPIATYDQGEIQATAAALTGWTLGGQDQRNPQRFFEPQRNYRIPMEAWPSYHDSGEKTILDGHVLPAGQSAQQDLDATLDTIFQHPNVGPFFCRFLIQRLVTSNPTPAYVYRCAQTFADDGTGVRGNLGAVVKSVLLDYEARSPDLVARQDRGAVREPLVRLLGLLRTIDAQPRSGRWRLPIGQKKGSDFGETPLHAPSVFNFFEPSYAQPGEIADAGLVSPELQITTETTIVSWPDILAQLIGPVPGQGGRMTSNLAPFESPAVTTDDALLDQVNLLLFGGSMASDTRQILKDALADPDFPRTPADKRVLDLLWLGAMAPESAVQR